MVNQNTQYVQGPKIEWTEDAGLHQHFKDWREKTELLLDMVLSHIRNHETKLKYVSLWAGKEARTYLSTVTEDRKDSLKTMLDTREDWTKPKSDEIAAFTHLRALNQGNKTLSTYIQEVRRVVDLCNFACVGDCKDRLIRNSIVAGLSSTKANQQCISKGSSLRECIKICQMEDATRRQVQALCPVFRLWRLHQYTNYPSIPNSEAGQATGAEEHSGKQAQPQGWPSHRGRDLAPETRLQTQY